MKLRIRFVKVVGNEEKKISRTFSKLDKTLTNENLKAFAQAFMSLTEIEEYVVEKITQEEI